MTYVPVTNDKRKKWNINNIKSYFDDQGCILLEDEYKGFFEKMKYVCPQGHSTTIIFSNFLQGHRCNLCANEKRRIDAMHTLEYVKNYIEVESCSGYKLLSNEYKGITEKIEVMCSNGHRYKVTFTGFKDRGSRCAQCQGLKNTLENIRLYVKNNSNHTLISQEYIRALDKLEFKCDHGHVYKMRFNDFKRGSRCTYCAGLARLTLEDLKNKISSINNDIEIIEDIRTNGTLNVRCKCKICENTWIALWGNISNNNTGCPYCSESKGERKIRQILIDNNISFAKEYTIDGCKNKRKLFFDFAIFHEDLLYCLIEYDGIQHFESSEFFGGEKRFEYSKKNDEIKNKYCEDNNILLIRIPYWDYENIEKILFEKILLNNSFKELVTI